MKLDLISLLRSDGELSDLCAREFLVKIVLKSQSMWDWIELLDRLVASILSTVPFGRVWRFCLLVHGGEGSTCWSLNHPSLGRVLGFLVRVQFHESFGRWEEVEHRESSSPVCYCSVESGHISSGLCGLSISFDLPQNVSWLFVLLSARVVFSVSCILC